MAFRIAFFGLPLAAILLDRDGIDIAITAISRSDAVGVWRAKKVFGERFVMKPNANDPAFVRRVMDLAPDLVVSWYWTKKLPMSLVHRARFGGIGVHPSLLPRHRGADPMYWAIASGDAETGVTVHRLEAEYDTGAVLAQERLAIDPAWNAWILERKLDRPSLRLLRSVVARFRDGAPPIDVQQDERAATFAPSPTDTECAITWSNSTDAILRHVRGLAPAPGAWTEVRGTWITILRAERVDASVDVLLPGEAVWDGEQCIVRTGDGAIRLLDVEIDGEPARREVLAALWADGARLG